MLKIILHANNTNVHTKEFNLVDNEFKATAAISAAEGEDLSRNGTRIYLILSYTSSFV